MARGSRRELRVMVLFSCLLLLLSRFSRVPTLCGPIDGSPLGSSVPGILQARTLEWIAISFSNAWKWKVKVKSLSRVRLLATPWTAAYQAPWSMGFSKQEYWRFSCLVVSNSFVTPLTAVRQAPQSMGFPRQEYCSGLPFPPSGDLLDPGIEPLSPVYHWATREAEGREVQRANRKGLICLLSPLRTRVTERPLTESVGTDVPLARFPPRRHGKCRVWWKAMEGCARHEAMSEGAKAVRSEKKGHVKEMLLRLCWRSTAYTFHKCPCTSRGGSFTLQNQGDGKGPWIRTHEALMSLRYTWPRDHLQDVQDFSNG